MAAIRRPWTEKKIARTQALVRAGLTVRHICFILEDEFGDTCSEQTLRSRVDDYGMAWPGRAAANPRNGAMRSWSEAKTARFVELWTDGFSGQEISRQLHAEFDAPYHSMCTLNRKARDLGLKSRRSTPDEVVVAQETMPSYQIFDFSNLKTQPEPEPAKRSLYACCQFPIGEPGKRSFRYCDAPLVRLGQPYCAAHTSVCYSPRHDNLEGGISR
jgi:hypothetical protein